MKRKENNVWNSNSTVFYVVNNSPFKSCAVDLIPWDISYETENTEVALVGTSRYSRQMRRKLYLYLTGFYRYRRDFPPLLFVEARVLLIIHWVLNLFYFYTFLDFIFDVNVMLLVSFLEKEFKIISVILGPSDGCKLYLQMKEKKSYFKKYFS